MKTSEAGFSFLELIVALGVIALVGVSASLVVLQLGRGIQLNKDYTTAVRQSENAGYWIGRDMRMAQSISADNLTLPNFLNIGWTEYDTAGDPTYHIVGYYFEDLTDGVGTLKRSHWSSDGANEETLIARDIYYNSTNETYTSRATFQNMELSLRLTSLSDKALESREYQIVRRINY